MKPRSAATRSTSRRSSGSILTFNVNVLCLALGICGHILRSTTTSVQTYVATYECVDPYSLRTRQLDHGIIKNIEPSRERLSCKSSSRSPRRTPASRPKSGLSSGREERASPPAWESHIRLCEREKDCVYVRGDPTLSREGPHHDVREGPRDDRGMNTESNLTVRPETDFPETTSTTRPLRPSGESSGRDRARIRT